MGGVADAQRPRTGSARLEAQHIGVGHGHAAAPRSFEVQKGARGCVAELGREGGSHVGLERVLVGVPNNGSSGLAAIAQLEGVARHRCGESQRLLLKDRVLPGYRGLDLDHRRLGLVRQSGEVQASQARHRRCRVVQDEGVLRATVAAHDRHRRIDGKDHRA